MSVMNKLTAVCWRNFQGDRRNKQMLFTLRCLHKSATSGAFGTTREEAIPERLITPKDAAQKKSVKTLAEMPGPGTISNLMEFFWRDGFSRIHEIQVKLCFLLFFLSICLEKETLFYTFEGKDSPPLLNRPRKTYFLKILNLIHTVCVNGTNCCVKAHQEFRFFFFFFELLT